MTQNDLAGFAVRVNPGEFVKARIFRTTFPEIAGLVRRAPPTSSRRSEVVAGFP
ncbi:hypothetical protein OG921_21540 [Aldersonia sp. NBC_00410]|uniref:hypothetical protein n=1 Tax=Aldersonia sp. NBC_00410 TaxID=2975954 RepID=UPI00225B53B6|nr:hypothetical protein [Aldersonia sp. NBC_00410]MCX5045753.1 hypothetical protein [Aldersonia sp. NBC_00410]